MALRARMLTAASYLLAAGFYASLWALVAVLVGGAIGFAQLREVFGVPGWSLSGWCAFTALFVVLAQFIAFRRRSAGLALEREAAPGLFELIDEVRTELGVGRVRDVRLKPAPLLGVTRMWRRKALLMRESRVLVIGLPLLRALSQPELRAAIAHELAHFEGGDVKRRTIVARAWRRIALMRGVLERGGVLLTWLNPVYLYLRACHALLRRASGAIGRAQECRADARAAQIAGPGAYARALVRGAVTALAFKRLAPGLAYRAATAEVGSPLRENLFLTFAEAIGDRSPDAAERLEREALRQPAEAHDEHPPLPERLAALGLERSPERPPGEPLVAALVPDLERVERALTPLAIRGLLLGFRKQLELRARRRAAAAGDEEADGAGEGATRA